MSAQTAVIEVDQRVAVILRALQEKAAVQGVSLVALLQTLAEQIRLELSHLGGVSERLFLPVFSLRVADF